MKTLSDTVSMTRWQAGLLLALSGFAIGNVIAKLTTALAY